MKKSNIFDPNVKIEKVMHDYKEGKLRDKDGKSVTSRKQAVAIAMSPEGNKPCNCRK